VIDEGKQHTTVVIEGYEFQFQRLQLGILNVHDGITRGRSNRAEQTRARIYSGACIHARLAAMAVFVQSILEW